ncbi:Zn(II)2Cys6 transcription factor [Aspergillus stella-maris]|uniref:Zn(II)2Cys6 transcription factor n=1 Tax=Aspergillus stella-maris TaxID=1810926 RepID=UPI003CCC9297
MDLTTPTATTTHAKRPHHCLNSPPNSDVSANRRKDPKTSRACDSCKAKKIRCSGTLPCSICLRRKLTCTFDGKYGRGRPPSPQSPAARTLEQYARSLTIDGQYVGTISNLSFLQKAWGMLSPQNNHLDSLSSDGTESHQPLASAGDIPIYQNTSTTHVFPDDDCAHHLLCFYFDNCVVTHRILHRRTVEAWLDVMLQNRAQGHPLALLVSNTKLAIILAVLAIAALRRHNIERASLPGVTEIGLEQSNPLFCAALQLTDSEVGFPVVESAQARLLQALYLLQMTRMNKAYYTVRNACHVIILWTAYIIDRYISVVLGRPRILHDDEVDQDFPDELNDEDMDHHGPSTAEPQESHLSSLILLARIARIIGQTSTGVYRVGEGQATSRLAIAHRMVQELHDWQGSLPAFLGAVKPTTLISSFRREETAFRLAYLRADEIRDECPTAARKTLELIGNIAFDPNVIYSLWWMQDVLFCALTVTDSGLRSSLHNLAESCRQKILHGSSAPIGHRYGIILEDLRLEAEHQISRTGVSSRISI